MSLPALVLIGGYGRSGSTLLEMLLSHRLAALGLGEVKYAWSRGFLRGDRCSCGRWARDCPVWGRIAASIGEAMRLSPGEVETLRLAVERNRHFWIRSVGGFASRAYREKAALYGSVLRETYIRAAEATGADVIVDSSKDPAHVELARACWDGPCKIVHLVRDPRAVVYARRFSRRTAAHRNRHGVIPSAVEWRVVNAGMENLPGGPADIVLRYEDLCADPSIIAGMPTALGLPAEANGSAIHHALSGNPVRTEAGDEIELRQDRQWETRLPRSERQMVEWLTRRAMRRYGYGNSIG